jgi:hypothetical protein
MKTMPLRPDETLLVGRWTWTPSGLVEDDVAMRIRAMLEGALVRVAGTDWEALYRDPRDGRLWELRYPQSEMHGGGPPTLRVIDRDRAREKYGTGLDLPRT